MTERILDVRSKPLRGASSKSGKSTTMAVTSIQPMPALNDGYFQGFGRFETGQDGAYRFRTIKSVPYPGHTPHIHMKLRKGSRKFLSSRLYVRGHALNERDRILRGIRDPRQRASVLVQFLPSNDRPGN